jgi:hypothetical protein
MLPDWMMPSVDEDFPGHDAGGRDLQSLIGVPGVATPLASMSVGGSWNVSSDNPTRQITDGKETMRLTFNSEEILKIVAASKELPSWKATIIERSSWEGTADENIEKYREAMSI